MKQYVVCKGYLVPSKKRGELPDIVYEYVSNTSDMGVHYDFTVRKEKAYLFDDFELDRAKYVAWLLNMEVKEVG
jgi:hypothetical protein